MKKFDVIVIGSGPGGYVSAIRSSQLGLSVACIDYWSDFYGKPALGGTCTNAGCIPSKTLLKSSEYFSIVNNNELENHGIKFENFSLNTRRMFKNKDDVVKKNNSGILSLFNKNKVVFYHGKCKFLGEKSFQGWLVEINKKQKYNLLIGNDIIIATGSIPKKFENFCFDEKVILSNKGALNINFAPKNLCILGAGAIGLEIGSIYRRLGSNVTILESKNKFLFNIDEQISKEAYKIFNKQGIKIILGVKIKKVTKKKNSVIISYQKDTNDKIENITFDKMLIAIGRSPYTNGLNTKSIGLKMDINGFIKVDKFRKTNLKNIWAIGDVVNIGPMLAHKAEEEGICVAENICGKNNYINLNTIPNVIYTYPEIAWVGKKENELKSEGKKINVGFFPFMANGRARAIGKTIGFVKTLTDNITNEILGVHIIGNMASELISEAVIIMEFHGSSEDISKICYAHPTLSESIKESAMSTKNMSINF